MTPERHPPTRPSFRVVQFVLGVLFPALAATAGFTTVFQAALPRAAAVLLMAWSLVLTYVASRRMTAALRTATRPTTRRQGTPDE